MYRTLRRRAGRYLNTFPAFKRTLRCIERVLMRGFRTMPEQPMPLPISVPDSLHDLVRAPVFARVLSDLDRERRRRRVCGPPTR